VKSAVEPRLVDVVGEADLAAELGGAGAPGVGAPPAAVDDEATAGADAAKTGGEVVQVIAGDIELDAERTRRRRVYCTCIASVIVIGD